MVEGLDCLIYRLCILFSQNLRHGLFGSDLDYGSCLTGPEYFNAHTTKDSGMGT